MLKYPAGLLKTSCAVLLVMAQAGIASAAPPVFDPVLDTDPFTTEHLLAHPPKGLDAPLRHYLRGVEASARLDERTAQRELAAAYQNPHAAAPIAGRALALAGNSALRAGDYRRASDLLDRAISEYGQVLSDAMRAELDQNRGAAMALRDEPAQSVEQHVAGTVPLAVNALGLTTGPAVIEGHDQVAVIDTGASASVLSATAARQLGVRILSRKTMTGSSTTAVESTMAMADTVRFGTMTLHHVAFIVLPDAALSPLGPEHRIDAIIGFPVLAALGRVTFREEAGRGDAGTPPQRSLEFAPSAPHAKPGNLRFIQTDPFLRVGLRSVVGDQALPLAVDSGSNVTYFGKRYAGEFKAQIAGLELRTTKTIGAGGAEQRQAAVIPTLDVAVESVHVTLSRVSVDLEGNGNESLYGTIGADLLWAKGGYTIDFGALELSLGPR